MRGARPAWCSSRRRWRRVRVPACLARLKAAYRFFDNAVLEAEALVAGHEASTVEGMQTVEQVVAVQDTTLLDGTHQCATTGLVSRQA
jgi:uncharacterized linocin/CFP29 family protein